MTLLYDEALTLMNRCALALGLPNIWGWQPTHIPFNSFTPLVVRLSDTQVAVGYLVEYAAWDSSTDDEEIVYSVVIETLTVNRESCLVIEESGHELADEVGRFFDLERAKACLNLEMPKPATAEPVPA